MICTTCRAAAAMLSETEVIYQYLDGRPQEMMTGLRAAEMIHGGCPEKARQVSALAWPEALGGQWCDCQHKVTAPGRLFRA